MHRKLLLYFPKGERRKEGESYPEYMMKCHEWVRSTFLGFRFFMMPKNGIQKAQRQLILPLPPKL